MTRRNTSNSIDEKKNASKLNSKFIKVEAANDSVLEEAEHNKNTKPHTNNLVPHTEPALDRLTEMNALPLQGEQTNFETKTDNKQTDKNISEISALFAASTLPGNKLPTIF